MGGNTRTRIEIFGNIQTFRVILSVVEESNVAKNAPVTIIYIGMQVVPDAVSRLFFLSQCEHDIEIKSKETPHRIKTKRTWRT